jgi:integrase
MAAEKPRRQLPPGIVERHSRMCASRAGGGCSCKPSIEAWVWSPRDGRKIRRTFTGRGALAAAKGWRRDAASDVGRGKMRAPTSATVADEARAWLERLGRGEVTTRGGRSYKPSVARLYRRDLERFVIPLLGSIKVSQLRRRDVQELLVDPLREQGLSGSRIRDVLNALRAVLRRPLKHDELQMNPVDEHLELPPDSEPRKRAASPAEAAALLAPLPEEDVALWATAFYAGLRRGELRALRDEDIDLERNVIHVRRGWDDYEGEVDPKSKKGARDVPMAAMLRVYLLRQRARTGRRGSDLFFGRTACDPFTPTHVRKRARGAWAAAAVGVFLRGESPAIELEPIGLQECRHTYVSLMVAAGRSLEEIGDYVGHSSAYMTDRYRHLLDGARQEAAAALDALLEADSR